MTASEPVRVVVQGHPERPSVAQGDPTSAALLEDGPPEYAPAAAQLQTSVQGMLRTLVHASGAGEDMRAG
jgi:hypothetical protein